MTGGNAQSVTARRPRARNDYADTPHPFLGACAGHLCRIAPVRDTATLSVTWAVPCQHSAYNAKPVSVLEMVIGHEAEGSLLALLKTRGLATALTAGVDGDDVAFGSGHWIFSVAVTLTVRGAAQWREVAALVVAAPRALAAASDAELERLWAELRAIRAASFRYAPQQDALDFAETTVGLMQVYPAQDTLSGSVLVAESDVPRLRALLALMTAARARYDLSSKAETRRLQALPNWGKPVQARPVQAAYARALAKTAAAGGATSERKDASAGNHSGSDEDEDEDEDEGKDTADSDEAAIAAVSDSDMAFDGNTVYTTKYFKVKFSREVLPPALLAEWDTAAPPAELQVPAPNEFIATDFTLEPVRSPWEVAPAVLRDIAAANARANAAAGRITADAADAAVAAVDSAVAAIVARQRANAAAGRPAFSAGDDAASVQYPAFPVTRALAEGYPALLRDSGLPSAAADDSSSATQLGDSARECERDCHDCDSGAESGVWLERAGGYPRHLMRHPALWRPAPRSPANATAAATAASADVHVPGSELWYLPDPRFRAPRGSIVLVLQSPAAYATPLHVVHTRLLLALLTDALDETTYAAEVAETRVETDCLRAGLEIRVAGLSHRLPALVATSVRTLLAVRARLAAAVERGDGPQGAPVPAGGRARDWDIVPRLLNLRTDVARYFAHMHFDPADTTSYMRLLVLQQNRFSGTDLVAAALTASGRAEDVPAAVAAAAANPDVKPATHITPEGFLAFLDEFMGAGLSAVMFVHGNYAPEQATALFGEVTAMLGLEEVSDTETAEISKTAFSAPAADETVVDEHTLCRGEAMLQLVRHSSLF